MPDKNTRPAKNRSRSKPAAKKTVKFTPRADKSLARIFEKIGTPKQGPIVPDDFQKEAVQEILSRDVLVSAPTGSGKTYIAVKAIEDILKDNKKVWYTTPLKALSNSKFHEFCDLFGKKRVGIVTGDRKENTGADVIVGTTEILRNQLYDAMAEGKNLDTDLVVLDEAHYLADRDRGVVWEEVIIYLPKRIRLLLLSATIPNATEIAGWIDSLRGEHCAVIESTVRPVPIFPLYLLPDGELVPLSQDKGIHKNIFRLLKARGKSRRRGRASEIDLINILTVLKKYNLLPAVFFVKSRLDCNTALKLCRKHHISLEKTRALQNKLDDFIDEFPFISNHPGIKFITANGLASHHGGHLPHWKHVVESLMNEGLLDAIFSTSTVAAGVNFPARTVVLMQSDRFDGTEFTDLSASELHQTTGRAGRRGKDSIGFALMPHGRFQNPVLLNKLFTKPPDSIESQVKIDFSMCLNLLYSQPLDSIKALLSSSFQTYQRQDRIHSLEQRYLKISKEFDARIKKAHCVSAKTVVTTIDAWTFNSKKLSRNQKRLSKLLHGQGRTVSDRDLRTKQKKIEKAIRLHENRLQALPCAACLNFDICCHDPGMVFYRLAEEIQTRKAGYSGLKDQLWNEFIKHLDFLILDGFSSKSGELTADGIWASKLRLDQPLIIAEMIRRGFLEKLTPPLLCAVISVFVNDRYRDVTIDPSFNINRKLLGTIFQEMINTVTPILTLKEKHRFSIPEIQYWSAVVLFAWANGKSWERIIRLTTVDEGDLAMLIYRTADNLRQITTLQDTHPKLAEKARAAIDLILKEPVVIPY